MIPCLTLKIKIPREYLAGRKIIGKECTYIGENISTCFGFIKINSNEKVFIIDELEDNIYICNYILKLTEKKSNEIIWKFLLSVVKYFNYFLIYLIYIQIIIFFYL